MTRSTGTIGLIFFGSPPSRWKADAHRREVGDGRHAGQVLEQHPSGEEGDRPRLRRRLPAGEGLDVVLGHEEPVAVSERVLEEDLDREGEPIDVGDPELLEPGEPVDADASGAGLELCERTEGSRGLEVGGVWLMLVLHVNASPSRVRGDHR